MPPPDPDLTLRQAAVGRARELAQVYDDLVPLDRLREGFEVRLPRLTGSAVPDPPPTHSGAGRNVSLRMRPLALSERLRTATVSLSDLLAGTHAEVSGATELLLTDYVEAILASGLPGIRHQTGRPRRRLLEGHLERVVDRDIPDDAGVTIRNPAALRRWMTAYAAASSTTAAFETIRDAASAAQQQKPSRTATEAYRDALTRVWILDDVPAWVPSNNRLSELGQAPKHQLADPALAAQLLGVQAETLLRGESAGPAVPRDGTLLGALFESLATQSLHVYAMHSEASVGHLRTARGRQEVDLIAARPDGRVLAIEVKLARNVFGDHGRHSNWLKATDALSEATRRRKPTLSSYRRRQRVDVSTINEVTGERCKQSQASRSSTASMRPTSRLAAAPRSRSR